MAKSRISQERKPLSRIAYIAVGLVVVKGVDYFGLWVLLPVGTACLLGWLANNRVKPTSKPMVPAFAVQAAYLAMMIAGLVFLGQLWNCWNLMAVAIVAGGLTWLITRPGLGSVIFLTLYQVGVYFLQLFTLIIAIEIGSPLYKMSLAHLILSATAVALMFAGLRAINLRRGERRYPNDPPASPQEWAEAFRELEEWKRLRLLHPVNKRQKGIAPSAEVVHTPSDLAEEAVSRHGEALQEGMQGAQDAARRAVSIKVRVANIRQGPNTRSPVIGRVRREDLLTLLDVEAGWYHVLTPDGNSGWLYRSFLLEGSKTQRQALRELGYLLVLIHMLGELGYFFYFSYQYVREHGLISWWFFGFVKPLLKSFVWEVFLVLTLIQSPTDMPGTDRAFLEEKVKEYQELVQLEPNDAESYMNLGHAYTGLGRYQQAVRAYKEAIRINPDYGEAYFLLGTIYAELGRHEEAVKAFKQAAGRLKEDYLAASAYHSLGLAYAELGQWEEAADAFKEAVSFWPEYAPAYASLGGAYLVLGDRRAALDQYDILKDLDPALARDLFNLIQERE